MDLKNLKLVTIFQNGEKDLTIINSDENGNYYRYIGKCCQKLFNYDLEEIRLSFKNKKLEAIYLITPIQKNESKEWISSEYNNLKISFEELFKQKSSTTPDETKGNFSSFWIGKKLTLILTFDYQGLKQFDEKFIKTYRSTVLISKNTSLDEGF